jgi:ferritin
MISEKMRQALNGQINAELYSSYLYLSMSTWFHSLGLPGCANWMRVQAQEELVHAMKIYDFINGRRGRVELQAIEAPPAEWDSPLAAFQATFQHEQKVTGLINSLVSMALAEHDHATNIFLQWFVTEQVEEEASASDVAQKLKRVGQEGSGLLMIDRELAARVFTMPAAPAAGKPAAG